MNAPKPESKFSFEKRWHPELTRFGHVQVSTFFLEHYHHLQPYPLTYEEAMFIIHLMQYKWGADAPFPAYATLAERMHVSVKTARRLAASIQRKKYLVRKFRTGQTNVFEFGALMEALASAARNPDILKKSPLSKKAASGK
jgi:hypothetical protein